jgi:hypothetical protein
MQCRNKPFRLDPEGRLGTFNHGPGRPDLGLPDGARGFDIHNDPELDIDEIVVRIGEERRALHRASHCAAGSDGEMNFGVTGLAAP